MEIFYFILSILIRISPFVRRSSGLPLNSAAGMGRTEQVAVWLPVIGWVSVSIQRMPESSWLQWRVVEVHSFGSTSTVEKKKKRRRESSMNRTSASKHAGTADGLEGAKSPNRTELKNPDHQP